MKKYPSRSSFSLYAALRIQALFTRERLLPVFILLPLLFFCWGCSSQPSGSPEQPGPLASLSFAPQHLILDNQNDFVWKQVTITLNHSYTYKTDLLSRGPSSIPLSAFRDSQGTPFDPSKAQPRHLTIDVREGFDGQPGQFVW